MKAEEIISSGLLELYALGQCNAEEARAVEQALNEFPEVQQELAEIEAGFQSYAIANAVNPSVSVKNKLVEQLKFETPISTSSKVVSIKPIWKYAAAASIVLLIGSAVTNFIFYNKYKEKDTQIASIKKDMDDMAKDNTGMKEDMNAMSNGVPVSLNGMETEPNAKAKIYWIQHTKEVYIDATNLPAPPQGKQYQFWGIVDGKPVDGGMIHITPLGNKVHLQKMKSFGKAEAFAVSLEKAGGNPTPTKVVSMGKPI